MMAMKIERGIGEGFQPPVSPLQARGIRREVTSQAIKFEKDKPSQAGGKNREILFVTKQDLRNENSINENSIKQELFNDYSMLSLISNCRTAPIKKELSLHRRVKINQLLLLLVGLYFSIVSACVRTESPSELPRYVITSPEIAEVVYALNSADKIVGVTEEIDYPPALKSIEKVGAFGAINIERIISLRPTIVFTSGLEQDKLSADLEKMGIKTVRIYPRSIAEMLTGIEVIAETIGIPERGKAFADSLKNELETIRYRGEQKPSVYFEIYGNPVMSVSDQSLIGEVISLAGGVNIFPKLPRDYSRIRQEDVITANPDIIILTYPGVSKEQIKNRKGWQNINACRNDRIYDIDDINPDLILRAGPRIIEGVRALQVILNGVKSEA